MRTSCLSGCWRPVRLATPCRSPWRSRLHRVSQGASVSGRQGFPPASRRPGRERIARTDALSICIGHIGGSLRGGTETSCGFRRRRGATRSSPQARLHWPRMTEGRKRALRVMGAEGLPVRLQPHHGGRQTGRLICLRSRILAEAAATHLESALLNAISVHPYAKKRQSRSRKQIAPSSFIRLLQPRRSSAPTFRSREPQSAVGVDRIPFDPGPSDQKCADDFQCE